MCFASQPPPKKNKTMTDDDSHSWHLQLEICWHDLTTLLWEFFPQLSIQILNYIAG